MSTGYVLLDRRNPNGDHFYATRRGPLLAIVVHVTAGLEDLDGVDDHSAERTAEYAATTDREVSWHSGSDTDSWVDLLPYGYTAWQCQGYNSVTAGHEISKRTVDWTTAPEEWVEATLRRAAAGLGPRARALGIPNRRASRAELDAAIAAGGPPVGFIEHSVLDPARRTDPGRTFPWARFLALMATTEEDDMTPEQCRDAVRQVLREELGADEDTSVRTAMWGLGVRAANSVLGPVRVTGAGERARIDTEAIGMGSPARTGVGQLVDRSVGALGSKLDSKLDQVIELLGGRPPAG
jgi:hypothetical protein